LKREREEEEHFKERKMKNLMPRCQMHMPHAGISRLSSAEREKRKRKKETEHRDKEREGGERGK
jgi:hypothetical protein